jgi:lipid II:glycine glycyltransferase (peptidoglycan interpeptide bridge formation enzyme)
VKALSIHGDGEPLLIYYREASAEICYVVLKNDIAKSPCFEGILPDGTLYDLSTPYGYGGFVYHGDVADGFLQRFFENLRDYCKKNAIVSQFIRFHPILQNQDLVKNFCDIVKLKQTIYIDTSSCQKINENLTSKNRNMVRKAQNNNITIEYDRGENVDAFLDIYNETMDSNGAQDYYYFRKDYFEYLMQNMSENMLFFYAKRDEEIVSSSMILYNDEVAHYHLSGTKKSAKKLAPCNLLLQQVAHWAAQNNIKNFHLGGGMEAEDSLFSFKKSFNKNGCLDFYVGRNIFMEDKFEELVELRVQNDPEFDIDNKFLIKYRSGQSRR